MNSKYDMQSLMEKNKPLLQEAAHPITFAQITEQNWLALIGLEQSNLEALDKIMKILSRSMTAAQMQSYLNQLTEIAEQGQNACTEIQEQIDSTDENEKKSALLNEQKNLLMDLQK